MATDPVCQSDVNSENPGGGKGLYLGRTYYFCCRACRSAFYKEPHKYAAAEGESRELDPSVFVVLDM